MDGMSYACRLETGYFSTREMGVFQRNYNLKTNDKVQVAMFQKTLRAFLSLFDSISYELVRVTRRVW